MIISESHPTPAMKLAAQVAASVGLVRIQPRQVGVESRLKPTVSQAKAEYSVALKQRASRFELRDADEILDVYVGADVRFYASEDGLEKAPDTWVAHIGLEYLLTYSLPPGPMPTDVKESGLAAFSEGQRTANVLALHPPRSQPPGGRAWHSLCSTDAAA